ncbi:MAG: hypothetical protein WA160_12945 [Pseudobdellovibrio sp.]
MLKYIIRKLEIDRHIAYSLVLRLWSILAGALLVLIIPHSLTKVQQGFYFTFSSLLAAQVFFELGLNTVITQMVGHEMAHLKFNSNNLLEGSLNHLNRMHSLFKLMQKIYKIMAILFFVVALVGGFVFFNSQKEVNNSEWIFVWPFLTFFTAVNLFNSPFLSSLEGMGLVSKISKLRLVQSVIGYLILWLCLFLQFGLKAMIAIPAASAVFSSIWMWKNYKVLFSEPVENSQDIISWRNEIFPFQWRIALSWLSGYFIFQLFNPIVFKMFGPESAGQVGLALTVFATIGAFSFSWVNAKVPVMTNLIALAKIRDLHQLFWSVLIRSSILNFTCCIVFVGMIELARAYHLEISQRVPSLDILIMLSIVCFVNNFIFSAASYMRAHKKEPMLLNSIFVSIFSVLGLYVGSRYSVFMIILIYAGIITLISLPWTIYLFKKFYSKTI